MAVFLDETLRFEPGISNLEIDGAIPGDIPHITV